MNTKTRTVMFVAVLLLSLVFAPTSHALPLAARDTARNLPVPPGDGFPAWYQDSNGLSLGQCLDSVLFCGLLADATFNPAIPVSFPTNYPGEQFYFLASVLSGPPYNLLYVAATEGSFAGPGNPIDGQQAVFSRIRIRADITLPGTYTVTHPYGTQTFVVDTPGIRALNFSNDVFGLVALSFDGPLDLAPISAPLVGPYLRPSAASGGAPLDFVTDQATGNKYIAIPGSLSPVTGAPTGNNFVEISGPDGVVRETLFDLVGKVVGLTASPASVSFAPQKPGVTTAATFTVTNPSLTTAATLGIEVITGTNAADFTLGPNACSGAVLAASGTCAVTVNFSEAAPGLFGAKSAVVSFPVTTPLNMPPLLVNLAGFIDNQLPIVNTTNPANNAINVPANNAITATFSETVTGVSTTTFTLTSGGAPVDGAVTYNAGSNTAVFTPAADLTVGGNFTATIVAAGITDLAGNALAQDTVINFTTTLPDTTPPAVVSVTPPDNTLVVPTSSVVTVKFNEPVDPASVNASTFIVKTSAGSVAGSINYDPATLTAKFTPLAALTSNELHTVTVTTGVKSLGGVSMAAQFTSVFVTNAKPTAPVLISPANNQTGVGTTVDFQWIKSTDSDNDPVTYKLYYCTNQFMINCDPVTIAQSASPRGALAGLGGYGAGILLAGVFIAGGVKSRRRLFLLLAVLLISGMVATACSSSGGGSGPVGPGGQVVDPASLVTKNVSGLTPATTYYWKVVADDGHGGLAESVTASFKTQ